MNINDVYVDQAMIASLVAPLHDTMLQRGYPKDIADRVLAVKAETAKLSADLANLCTTLQTPESPGLPGMTGAPL